MYLQYHGLVSEREELMSIDEVEKAKSQEKPTFMKIPIAITGKPLSAFVKLEGRCAICETATADSFCSECRNLASAFKSSVSVKCAVGKKDLTYLLIAV